MFSRRKFLLALGGLAAVSLASYKFLAQPVISFFEGPEPTPSDWETITLLADEILPKTANSPSASEAGVIDYMKKTLAGDVSGWRSSPAAVLARKCALVKPGYGHLKAHYRKTAERLSEMASEKFQKTFTNLSTEERSQIVTRFAEGAKADVGYNVLGTSDAAKASDKNLFELIRRHSLEGYFADPRNGGNKDYVAWESIRHTCHHNYPKEAKDCKKI